MKDRIRQIMESKHMTQQVFAQFIDMSPASLSSIFNGRTKPTLNIVEAIKKKIPEINIDWLLFGSGEMYGGVPASHPTEDGGHAVLGIEPTLDFEDDAPSAASAHLPSGQAPLAHAAHGGLEREGRQEIIREEIKYVERPPRKVVEIRVYYDDLTYETFVPAKK